MCNRLSTTSGFSTPYNTSMCGSVSPSKTFEGAELFPVALGVQVPYVGGGETAVRRHHASLALHEEYPLKLAPHSAVLAGATLPLGKGPPSPKDESSEKLGSLLSHYNTSSDKSNFQLPKSYLKKVSCGLTFDEGVLQDRAPHTLPYKEDKLKCVFKTQGLVHPKQKHIGPVGRHDPRSGIQQHPPCHLRGSRKLKPLKRSKTVPIKSTVTERMQPTIIGQKDCKSTTNERPSSNMSKHEWDEHVLACLSKTTADLILKDHRTGPDKERLVKFLAKRNQALEKSEETSNEKNKEAKSDDALEKTMSRHSPVKKSKDRGKSQKDGVTLQDIHYSPLFTLPSCVGDKKLETQNIFQQEMLAGAQPVLSKKPEEGVIILDTNDKLKFQKQLQDTYPQGAREWFSQKKQAGKKKAKIKSTKGLQRWNQLPVVVQDDSYISSMPSTAVDLQTLMAGYKLKKKIKEDSNVVKIVEEWRSKWFLERKWQNSSTQELIKAMNDINDHVRLSAVSACSKAAEIRQKAKKEEPSLGIQLLDKSKEEDVPLVSTLEPDLIDTIRSLLDDRNTQVRIAAAITLYTINKPDDKTKSILLWTMSHGGAPERWAATQCLAMSSVITDNIIAELVSQLQSDTIRAEKAGVLLADLSRYSGIVHSLIAELLNSSSWKDRITACKVIPKLNGGINKDMTQKLSYLMWNDWSKDVRTVAAQALGRTGNGKLVHDALRERILTGNERVKVDALKKLSNLGIMTVRLLPALLDCFKSEYVSVRIEAAMVAGLLHITDNKLISVLQWLASDDRSWKVKAHAIKALGSIGVVDDKLIEVLVWAIRYDKVAAVRAEACNAVAALGLRDERLLSVLQDRLVVESEELVKREAISALESLGVEPVGDIEMIEAIRKEVRRLCNRNSVVSHILTEDQAAEYKDDYKRLLTTQESERESTVPSLRQETTLSRSSETSERGWDPILAGYQAREIMSRARTPGELRMERSLLPMDLNSASSENSSVYGTDNWSEGEGLDADDYPEREGEGHGTVDRVPSEEKQFERNENIMGNIKLENDGMEITVGTWNVELDPDTVGVSLEDRNSVLVKNPTDYSLKDGEAERKTAPREERAAEYSVGEPELLRLVEQEDTEHTGPHS